jgi:hypothetical protein
MPIDDPNTWMQGAAAAKAAVDGIRSAIKMVKDIRGLGGGTEQEQKAIDVALRPPRATPPSRKLHWDKPSAISFAGVNSPLLL